MPVIGRSIPQMDADDVRQAWAARSGEYSPDYYAYYGSDEASRAILDAVSTAVDPDARILELGCSSGRHLAYLLEHGYRRLHGIDVNPTAFDVMERDYPALAEAGSFHVGAIEDVVTGFPDGRFDVVFSVETLQHIHPDDDWVFAEVARVTGDRLLTIEIEGDREGVNVVRGEVPLFYRDWGSVFSAHGLDQIETRAIDRATFRAFRPAPE